MDRSQSTLQPSGPLDRLSQFRSAIMGFAALWILFFHMWIPVFPQVSILGRIESGFVNMGLAGVDIFLLVSGFGLTHALKRSALLPFYYRRFKRLILPFVFIGLLHIPLAEWSIRQFLLAVTWITFYRGNTQELLWFVPAVGTLYLLFPFYYRLMLRSRHPFRFTAGALALWMAACNPFYSLFNPDLSCLTARIPIFLIGVLAGWMSQQPQYRREPPLLIPLALLFTAFGFWLGGNQRFHSLVFLNSSIRWAMPNLFIALGLCVLLPAALDQPRVSPRLVRGLGFLGSFSFENYCVQEFLAYFLLPPMQAVLPPLAADLIFTVLDCFIAWLLYRANIRIWAFAESRLAGLRKE